MDKRILNLTQHCATPEQVADGVIEPSTEAKEQIERLLIFDTIPLKTVIDNRANLIVNVAVKESAALGGWISEVMIGGEPYLMGILECVLINRDITPLYSFIDESTCKHVGFVSAR